MIEQYNIKIPKDFIEQIYQLQTKSDLETLRSNVGGWQSKQYKEFTEISWAEEFFKQCLTIANLSNPLQQVWFNINPNGAFHKWHCHGGSDVVGVVYVQVPNDSGNIEFRGKISKSVKPTEGMLLIFPGKTDHQVLKNNSHKDRITMAFNLGPTT